MDAISRGKWCEMQKEMIEQALPMCMCWNLLFFFVFFCVVVVTECMLCRVTL